MAGEKIFAQGIISEFTIRNVSRILHKINNFSNQARQEKTEDHRLKLYIRKMKI